MLWHEATRAALLESEMALLFFVPFYFLLVFFFQKASKGRAPISRDSKIHFKLRGRVVQGLGPIEALTQQQGEQRFLYIIALGIVV